MNRQIRRDQERKQEKQDKDKEKRRNERRRRREEAKSARARRKEEGRSEEGPRPRTGGRAPGRFSGALAAATVFFILLQGIVPSEEMTLLNTAVSAGFYLLFGYFATLWLLRRAASRPIAFAIAAGAALGLGVELGKYLRPEFVFDPLLAVMILPALVIGTLLGRLVYVNAPG